jgi:hypothetical protein
LHRPGRCLATCRNAGNIVKFGTISSHVTGEKRRTAAQLMLAARADKVEFHREA